MAKAKEYFDLDLDSLRSLAGWAADCAEMALRVFEEACPGDLRPRQAIAAAREFAAGGKRSARLRVVALAALAAAREAGGPAAKAAATAAGLAAASAYTHPLVDVAQTKHIVGPAAYAALALESRKGGETQVGALPARGSALSSALGSAPPEVREVLSHMPARGEGKGRADLLMFELDRGLRGAGEA